MEFSIIVIGDEILNGRRKDKHLEQSIALLAARGMELTQAHFIGDVEAKIIDMLQREMKSKEPCFCFGGIGATPDDLTRACAAKAAGVKLARHSEAVKEIERQFGKDSYPNRILMADLPEGSELIPNPYNRVPGFSVGQIHFFPGFPEMAKPMMEWVLDNKYKQYQQAHTSVERKLRAYAAHESELLDVMNQVVQSYPKIRFSSLPHVGDNPFIEFGFKGDEKQVNEAFKLMLNVLKHEQLQWEQVD